MALLAPRPANDLHPSSNRAHSHARRHFTQSGAFCCMDRNWDGGKPRRTRHFETRSLMTTATFEAGRRHNHEKAPHCV
ncbi:unnamed protein product [Protopolystoma xenopodis]|uniref:Uncharacterized protein n=1 Tax=Protopolystoma xenopodis TaxID=117903 RepID=A0A3S5AST9_9PLAT|nr:unnamed protein product [Protopolystoma xenopodis]